MLESLLLEGEIAHRVESCDPDLVVGHFVDSVLAFGKNEAVGLSVHSLGTESGGGKNYLLALGHQLLQTLILGFNDSQLDQGILLRKHALALSSIVIGAHLLVLFGVD